MRKLLPIPAVAVVLILARPSRAGPLNPHYQQPTQVERCLATPVQNYDLTAGNFLLAFLKIAGEYDIPMGIEWLRTPAALKPVHLAFRRTDVGGAIRAIARTQHGYTVDVEGGVVHIYPEDATLASANFLVSVLDRFDVHDVAEIASKRLATLVRQRVSPPKPTGTGGGIAFSQAVEIGDPSITVSLTRPTVEEVLDAIVKASPFRIWVVTFSPARSVTPTGFWSTVSPTTGKPFADRYQPVWELLRWGQGPY